MPANGQSPKANQRKPIGVEVRRHIPLHKSCALCLRCTDDGQFDLACVMAYSAVDVNGSVALDRR